MSMEENHIPESLKLFYHGKLLFGNDINNNEEEFKVKMLFALIFVFLKIVHEGERSKDNLMSLMHSSSTGCPLLSV